MCMLHLENVGMSNIISPWTASWQKTFYQHVYCVDVDMVSTPAKRSTEKQNEFAAYGL